MAKNIHRMCPSNSVHLRSVQFGVYVYFLLPQKRWPVQAKLKAGDGLAKVHTIQHPL